MTQPSGSPTKPDTEDADSAKAKRAQKRKRARVAAAKRAQDDPIVVRPVAVPAQTKKRHWGLLISFFLMVSLPICAGGWYLYSKAVDQYASTLGFTVRSEDVSSSASDLLGGLGTSLGGGSASRDADILYEYILSQEIVRKIDQRLDLRSIYAKHHATDPLLSYNIDGTIEDLTQFWKRMVRVSYDVSSGLMELRVLAFSPDDAKAIAGAIYDESSKTINELSAIARADATRYAQEDLDLAFERLKQTREALTAFRLANQIVDPNADIQTQMGLLTTLQTQQAEALIELDLLTDTASDTDPRLDQARRRLEVIVARITEERRKFGTGGSGPGGVEYARTIADFERLSIEREFAEQSYAVALTTLDSAKAEANRQSRYLAVYIQPTLAEKAEFPQREVILSVIALFSFLIWAIVGLVFYSLRDRR